MAVVMVCITKRERERAVTNGSSKELRLADGTYAGAAHGDEEEGLNDPGRPDDPSETDEQDDAKDVLHAREVDPGESAQLGGHFGLVRSVRVDGSRSRGAVVGQGADQSCHSRAFLVLLLVDGSTAKLHASTSTGT